MGRIHLITLLLLPAVFEISFASFKLACLMLSTVEPRACTILNWAERYGSPGIYHAFVSEPAYVQTNLTSLNRRPLKSWNST
ncbi:hypothetical protein BO71DRAFT_400642 [Aspergillus ellipticus CBS 707.79]|uniref:Secreted protein n=1 Tax=Aspergillus ellipticus CBS 707.79 TaxID=1448320 RepID=A0A319D547_9EURO|nr:hypothetical protein BO71DRAFT_400642 [Aspergillus ellipticus CBS 707.79]